MIGFIVAAAVGALGSLPGDMPTPTIQNVSYFTYCYADIANYTSVMSTSSCTHIKFRGASLPTNLNSYCSHTQVFNASDLTGDINPSAFENCGSLLWTYFPNMQGSIKEKAFYNCSSLILAQFDSMQGNIEKSAFEKTKSLAHANFPQMTGAIKESAFSESGIIDATFPKVTESIGMGAFHQCDNLTSVEFPEMTEDIEPMAFFSCDKLEAAKFPKMKGSIGPQSFFNDQSLQTTDFSLLEGDIGKQAFLWNIHLKNIVFPNMKGSLDYRAFDVCMDLETAQFPEMTGVVGRQAFKQCGKLNSVDLGKATALEEGVFDGTVNLWNVCLDSVTTANIDAFEGSSLRAVHMPKLEAHANFSKHLKSLCANPSPQITYTCGSVESKTCAHLPAEDDDDDDALVIGLSVGGGVLGLGLVFILVRRKGGGNTKGFQLLL